ncbi:hypothetical protein [Roseicitreum antarcticum]|uniref:Uncharacterized protein n=1 Tax=Roseicitreum antarcticum TaxID=564137 RepID=A0A1H3BTS8_9RHOB|nr:hypothetical protein [Roseicitreum antarcticum]SDX45293.1 hypothetical protein SAMN04488238_108178 [Roseicitreum antarcticum]
MAAAPQYYFRTKPIGGVFFRIVEDPRWRRMDMQRVAGINVFNGQITPNEGQTISAAEHALIKDWITQRRAVLNARQMDDIHRTVDHLNLTAHWAQFNATPDELETISDTLLMAMHDLRDVLVRKRAHRVESAQGGVEPEAGAKGDASAKGGAEGAQP